jgi:hypothetical protein
VSLLYSTIISFGLTILDLPRRPKYLGLLFYKTKISFWIDYFKPSEERPKYLVSLLYGTEISSTVDRIISKLRRPKYLWCPADPIRFSFTSVTDGAFPRGNVACLASKFRSPGWDGSTETAQRTELSRGPRPVRFMPSSLFVAAAGSTIASSMRRRGWPPGAAPSRGHGGARLGGGWLSISVSSRVHVVGHSACHQRPSLAAVVEALT